MSRKCNKQRFPLTPKKMPKTLFVVDGSVQIVPRKVADDLGVVIDMAGANDKAKPDRFEGDWGFYVSRFGMGLVHCMVHQSLHSTDDFSNDDLFRMRTDTTAKMYLSVEGLAKEAVEMGTKLRSRIKASSN